VTSRAKKTSQVVAELVLQDFIPNSIIDIGAGDGTWMTSLASNLGSTRLTAVDLPGSTFEILKGFQKSIEFLTLDFENSMIENGVPYDLAICVEVIEHISHPRGLILLDWISDNCRTVIFSGAIPGQGGTLHINEQNQDYWLRAMMNRGFIPIDNIRPILFKVSEVPSYYRNNIFFFVNSNFLHETRMSHLLFKTIRQDSFGFTDVRSYPAKFIHRLIAILPVGIVTFIAELKSKFTKA